MKKHKCQAIFLFFLLFCCFAKVFAQKENGTALYQTANTLFKNRDFRQALAPALAADSIFHALADASAELESKVLVAAIYYRLGRHQSAAQACELSVPLLVPAGKRDSLIEAELMNTYGNCLMDLRRFEECEAAYRRSIRIKEQLYGEKAAETGREVSNLGNMYFKKGELAKSIEYNKMGLALREKVINPNPALVGAYTNLGIMLNQAGLSHQALDYYDKVAVLIANDPVRFQDRLAPLYQSLANAHHNLGNFDESKQYSELAILNYRNQKEPPWQSIADIYYNLALVARDLKDPVLRLEYAKKALDITQSQPEPDSAKIAECYGQIGLSFLDNQPDSTLYYMHLSRVLLGAARADYGLNKASNLSYTAMAMVNKGDFRTADSLMTFAVAEVTAIYGQRHVLTGNYRTNHADMLKDNGQYEAALTLYDASLAAYGYSQGCSWDTVVLANEVLDNLGKKNHALTALYGQMPTPARAAAIEAGWREISNLLDYLRRKHQGNETQLLFAAQFKACAENAIEWYVEKNDPKSKAMAWMFAEKSRSLDLLEAFRHATARNTVFFEDSLRSMSDAFLAEKNKWRGLYEEAKRDTARAAYLLKILETNRQEEQWLRVLERRDTSFFNAKYNNSIVDVKTVRALLQPKQALLEYFVGNRHIYLFVIRHDTFMVQKVPLDFPLNDWIEQLRHGIHGYHGIVEEFKKPDVLRRKCLDQYHEFAPKLYQKLVAPVQKWLPEQGKIVIVPDGPIGLVPFDALLTAVPEDKSDFSSYPYLFRKHTISYAYSATLLKAMRDKKHRRKPSKEVLAFAPFYYSQQELSKGKQPNNASIQGDQELLRFSGPEADSIVKLMTGNVFLGSDATKKRFAAMAGDYRILHIATHAQAGDDPFLYFAAAPDSTEKTLLYTKELYNFELDADMVVLSACETGIGKLRDGEGIISLGYAFAYAGSKSIVTTLWKVDNQNNAALMPLFYRELKHGKTKDEALRNARETYFKNATSLGCHPFFWAAFVPMGDMRAIK